MTQGLHRFYDAGDLHFIAFSCYRRLPLFDSEARRDLWLAALERVRRRRRLVVLGYVVMPEHVYLLLTEPQQETLSTVIQAAKLGVVRTASGPSFLKLGETRANPAISGRFWQNRFYDLNVRAERERQEKLRYIHRNPVKRGLVESPGQWRRRRLRNCV